jgi:predicted HAD superfamily Cof-like phosphohydrolase
VTLVREFHLAVNAQASIAPSGPPLQPDADIVRKRLRLIDEEYKEVRAELIALTKSPEPAEVVRLLRALLKELADLRYVVEGTAVSLGLPIDEAFEEVHRSNMSKFDKDGLPIMNSRGKVLKGPHYSEADMAQFVPDIITIQEVGA